MKIMKHLTTFITALLLTGSAMTQTNNFRLVVHGGAGMMSRNNLTPEVEKAYHDRLQEALKAGYDVLAAGGSSTNAVIAAIVVLEDCPLFNAGKGAVFTNDGRNELDASIMEGQTLKAGAVAGVTTIKNPIIAAYTVMTKTPHVMLAGVGADTWAKTQGLEIVDPSYFRTEQRWRQLERAKERDVIDLEHDDNSKEQGMLHDPLLKDIKYGTVGAVALDKHGNLAAGTSTGGMTNKRFGRIGDAPIIGAGTYADNETVAVSATGTGEMFIRTAAAYQISARMKFGGESMENATQHTLNEIMKIGGYGGVIVIDKNGNYHAGMTTGGGMYRGTIGPDGKPHTAIFGDDKF
jgi:beta-aspartyl-peptidase (threonine type)